MDPRIFFFLAMLVTSSVSVGGGGAPVCACARIYQPVCASDGHTSNNMCEFECRAAYLKQYGRELFVVKQGRCEDFEYY